MDKKICSECGTANESEYLYCKNCGAPLAKKQPEPQSEFIGNEADNTNGAKADPDRSREQGAPFGGYTPPPYGAEGCGRQYSPYSTYAAYAIDGIPAEDVAFFIGKKSAEIMPKFMKMEITRSKVSWCWPAAILGFIFGPFGAALWFFYRKMYKIALILLAVGTVLTFTTTALTYDTNSQSINGIFESITEGNTEDLLDAFENIGGETTALDILASGLEDLASLATCVLCGLFGFYAYKNHCIKSIKGFLQNGIDQRYYRMGLASLGGVSGGMLAVGIISMIVIENISYAFTVIFSLL